MKNGIIMAIVLAVWGFLKMVFKMLRSIIQVLSSLIVFLGLYIPLFYVFFGLILLATTDFTLGGTGTNQIMFYIGFALCCVAAAIITIRNLLIRPISSVFAAFRKEESRPVYERDADQSERRADDYASERASRNAYGRQRDAMDHRKDNALAYERSFSSDAMRNDMRYDRKSNGFYEEEEGRLLRGIPSNDSCAEPFRRPVYPRMDETPDPFAFGARTAYDRAERPLVYYSKRRPGVLVKEYSDRFELFEEDANGRRYIGTEYKDD